MEILDYIESRVKETSVQLNLGISHAEQMEMAGHLVSGAPSLNDLKSSPGDYSVGTSLPINVILRRIQSVEHMLSEDPMEVEPIYEPKDYCRYTRWQLIAAFWCGIQKLEPEGATPLLTLLLCSQDVGQLKLPGVINPDGGHMSCLDSDQVPDEQKISWILTHWLSQWNDKDPTLMGHWDRLRDMAIAHKCSSDVAELYRSACRETYNHTWSLAASIALGIYDYPVERGSFFDGEVAPADVQARIESIWRWEEPEAMD